MKKTFLKLFMIGMAFSMLTLVSCSKEETANPTPTETFLASTVQMNKVAVLEDFTGVRCGYCPDGHLRAKAIVTANPGKFLVIANHSGGYAAPSAGWMNFTSVDGSTINVDARIPGYPAGTISRMANTVIGTAQMSGGGPNVMGRGEWTKGATAVMAMPAPVNIGAKAVYNSTTKMLTVSGDLFFTSEETVTNNINIILLQDHIFSKQSGGTPDPNNYEQNGVLRQSLTGAWGEPITSATTAGAKVKLTNHEVLIPDYYNGTDLINGGGLAKIDDMKVILFVTRGKYEILNAIEISISK